MSNLGKVVIDGELFHTVLLSDGFCSCPKGSVGNRLADDPHCIVHGDGYAHNSAQLENLYRLSDAATPGPWIRRWQSLDVHHMGGDNALRSQADVDFAIAACEYVRQVLQERDATLAEAVR